MAPRSPQRRALAAALPLALLLAAFSLLAAVPAAEAAPAPSPQVEQTAPDGPRQEQPRTSNDEGVRITWKGVLIPLLVALAIIFVVGLFLMRLWHWIDPS